MIPSSKLVSFYTRRVGLACAAVTVLSWGHNELTKKRLLAPLPLPSFVANHNLPPVLPEEVNLGEPASAVSRSGSAAQLRGDSLLKSWSIVGKNSEASRTPEDEGGNYGKSNKPAMLQAYLAWRARAHYNGRVKDQIKRAATIDKLVKIQNVRRRQQKDRQGAQRSNGQEEPLGYALVTGASRGIGRAMAVELARHGIPLILVARDLDSMKALASDLKTCYGGELHFFFLFFFSPPVPSLSLSLSLLLSSFPVVVRRLFSPM